MAASTSAHIMPQSSSDEINEMCHVFDAQNTVDMKNAVISWMSDLLITLPTAPTQQCHVIDLQQVCTVGCVTDWEKICQVLCKLLVQPTVIRVIVHDPCFRLISGKCGKHITDCALQPMPSKFYIHDVEVNVKNLVKANYYTDKIKSDHVSQQQENEVINFLEGIINKSKENKTSSLFNFTIKKVNRFLQKASKAKMYTIPDLNTSDKFVTQNNCTSPQAVINNDSNDTGNNTKNSKGATLDHVGKNNIPKKSQSKCYICKQNYPKRRGPQTMAKKQYPRLCSACAENNYQKRFARTDLVGKFAIVTGARIKIGYEIVLKLLRDGCHVIATTRFPRNAARAYSMESDYSEWNNRLHIYPLDLKDIRGECSANIACNKIYY